MFKKIVAICLIAMPVFSFAAGSEPQHEGPAPRFAAATASAPVAAPANGKVSQRQLMAACKAKVEATGVKGATQKAALRDCLKAS